MNPILRRILAAEGKVHVEDADLHRDLLREFFRRMVIWTKEFRCLDEWPYCDVAAHFDPSIRATPDEVETLQKHLQESEIGTRSLIDKTLCLALHWGALTERYPGIETILPDPYEPIIVMHERGGFFQMEGGHLIMITWVTGIPRYGWEFYDRPTPFVELGTASSAERNNTR